MLVLGLKSARVSESNSKPKHFPTAKPFMSGLRPENVLFPKNKLILQSLKKQDFSCFFKKRVFRKNPMCVVQASPGLEGPEK